jgi:hypothetical protein
METSLQSALRRSRGQKATECAPEKYLIRPFTSAKTEIMVVALPFGGFVEHGRHRTEDDAPHINPPAPPKISNSGHAGTSAAGPSRAGSSLLKRNDQENVDVPRV